jgi:hypothetical protein
LWARAPRDRAAIAAFLTGGTRDWAIAGALAVALAAFFQLAVPLRGSFGARITGDEPFYLLTTLSLWQDGDLDLANQYAREAYREFFDESVPLWYQSVPTADGRVLSPHNPGLSLLILPAYAWRGLDGVKAFLALLGGAAMGCAYLLARRITGSRWPSLLAAAAVGVSAPAFVYATQIYPEMPAALLVAVILLLNVRGGGGAGRGIGTALLLGGLLWLGVKYAPLAACLGALAVLWLAPRGRIALVATSAALAGPYVWFHLQTYGELTPYAVNLVYAGTTAPKLIAHHLEFGNRLYRLVGLWIDREFGLVRWAPILALALPAVWPVARSPERIRWWLLLPLTAEILVAVFLSITMRGWWFPGRMLIVVLPLMVPLVAVGLSLVARSRLSVAVAAVLALGTISATLSLWSAARALHVTLAVNPFDAGGWWLEGTKAFWPLYTAYTWETVALSGLGIAAAAGLVWLGEWLDRKELV